MKFYEIDHALQDAINAADSPVRVKIDIEVGGHFESVFEQDIVEANFYGLKEAAGGTTARGEILLENQHGIYSTINTKNGVGREVRVSFSVGDGLPYFQRFTFFVDDKGIQDIRGAGRKRFVRLGLRDFSEKLRKADDARDWIAPAVFTYTVVCDKERTEKSLVHNITSRAGISACDIECSNIPVTLPFVRLRRNVWAELSSLATAYRCHLECTPDKRLVFDHSPYQINEQGEISNEQFCDEPYLIRGEDIFYLRKTARADLYRNSIRLKVNMPISLERQEIWRYDEAPVFYDEDLKSYYPFRYPLVREIEAGKYEAVYRVIDENGRERAVIFADEIDTQDEAENRLEYKTSEQVTGNSEKSISYSHYDVTTNYDKAILTLQKEADGDLYKAVIYGRPIVLDLNRSCFMRDSDAVNQYGTYALNVTGGYFSEYTVNKIPHYEDWVKRELAERIQNRREFTVKTHRGIFNARVGASVKIALTNETLSGTINAFSFRYRKDEAFVATFRILATGENNEA